MNWILECYHEGLKKWREVYEGEAGMNLENALGEMAERKKAVANYAWWHFRIRNTETGEVIPGALFE